MTCSCCMNRICTPPGCNCTSCQRLDREVQNHGEEKSDMSYSSEYLIESWVWARQPGESLLYNLVH